MPKNSFIFKNKENSVTAECSCGNELFTDYADENGILECSKCYQKYNLNDFKENATALINSLLSLFPKDYALEEPSLKENEEGYGKKLERFWLFNSMMIDIRNWKKKAEYYDKIHQYAKTFTDNAYFNLGYVNPQLQQYLFSLIFSVSYENNKHSEKIQIY